MKQLKAEFFKVLSLRSSWILLISSIIVTVGFALLSGWSLMIMRDTMMEGPTGDLSQVEGLEFFGTGEMHGAVVRSGAELSVLLIGVLAVLMMAGEHTSGSIRSSLLAQPKRWVMYLSKAVAMSVITVVVTAISLIITHFAVYGMVEELGGGVSLFDEAALRQYAMVLLYAVMYALMGVGFGALLRNSAGAIVLLFVISMALPILWMLLPEGWISDLGDYLPSMLFTTAVLAEDPAEGISRAVAAIGLAIWGVVVLLAGGFRLQKSDIK